MAKANLGQIQRVDHSFVYGGVTFELTLNQVMPQPVFKARMDALKEKYPNTEDREQQLYNTLALNIETVLLFVVGWNLEDDQGDIPLQFDEIQNRVPIQLINRIVEEAQEGIRAGGLSKKN